MFKYFLILLGLITAIVVCVPQFVVLGYFFLIIPGLILTLIPTVFVYSLVTYLIRFALPTDSPFKGTMIAACLSISLGFLVMIPWRMIAQRQFHQAALPEITPAEQIQLSGNVMISRPKRHPRDKGPVACDAICTAVLDQIDVDSVTLVFPEHSATFRLGQNVSGTLVPPHQPHTIFDSFNAISRDHKKYNFQEAKNRDRQLIANWALRIANGDVVKRSPALPADQMDWQISFEKQRVKSLPRIERMEVKDQKGDIVIRKSLVEHKIPVAFFCFGFELGSAGGGFSSARFNLLSYEVSNRRRHHTFNGIAELLESTTIAKPNPPADSVSQLEQTLSKFLDSDDATDAELLLAPMWLDLFQYNADETHLDLIAKILLDDRIPEPYEPLQRALSSKADLSPLREGIAKRFLSAKSDKAKTWYISTLVKMPRGTFAKPTANELAIWNLAHSDDHAAPFLERMADRGPSSVSELVDRINQVLEEPWHLRRHVLDGVCKAFIRLGPDASSAIPHIRSLLEKQRSPLTNSSKNRTQWLVALCRMGVAADELPFGSWVSSPTQLEHQAKRIRDQVRRYEAEQ